ncbi:unnamed protein product [Clonostachys byssicola]|uniref:DUF7924 domain-containing protein n=1 Tax=Clonostachys byssicola TaxID=160290 RepID=A0A9N9UR19_9HYPO|nr:unnamed protein product [Clonostachys byssicola]
MDGTRSRETYSLYENPLTFEQSSHGESLLNWLESVKPYGLRRCRSETNIQLLPDFCANRAFPDTDITPSLDQGTCYTDYHVAGVSRSDGSDSSSEVQQKAAHSNFRPMLFSNGIDMVESGEMVPSNIQSVVDFITSECGQPLNVGKSALEQDSKKCENMAIKGAYSYEVKDFFYRYLFSSQSLPDNIRGNETTMKRDDVPIAPSWGAGSAISTPDPDLLLGYDTWSFPITQIGHLYRWDINNTKFSFLSVDYQGDHTCNTSRLWVATNHCMVATATCVQIMKKLRAAVLERGNAEDVEVASSLDLHVFGLVTNGTEARLFVTYPDESEDSHIKFHVKLIRGFLLYDIQHRADLKRCVEKIFEWAEERRGHIMVAIDVILSRILAPRKKRKRRRGE